MSQNKIVLMACGSFSPPTYMHLRMFEIARDHIHSLGLGTVIGGIISPVHDAYGKKDLVAAHHRVSMLELCTRDSWVKVSSWETEQAGWTRTRLSLMHHQEVINRYLETGGCDEKAAAWLPDDVINVNSDPSEDVTDNIREMTDNMAPYRARTSVTVKLLCGADLLESFATPGLWTDEDVAPAPAPLSTSPVSDAAESAAHILLDTNDTLIMETIVVRHGLVVVARGDSTPDDFIHESDLLYKHRRSVLVVRHERGAWYSSSALRRLLRRRLSARYLAHDDVLRYCAAHRLYTDTEYKTPTRREYGTHGRASPREDRVVNVPISFRDRPSVVDETIAVKRPRRSNLLLPHSHTDSVSPLVDATPKLAYVPTATARYKPGKVLKVTSDGTSQVEDKVSVVESTYSSLESYLLKEDAEVYRRRVSEGNVDTDLGKETIKKRCSSSTIRKLTGKKPPDVKKSKSEVSKLCEKMMNVKLKDKDSGRNYKTRSCNDIVRLVLTKHGIHVISDTEAIV